MDLNQTYKSCIEKHKKDYDFSVTDFSLPVRRINRFLCKKHKKEIKILPNSFIRIDVPCKICRLENKINKFTKDKERFDYSITDFKKPNTAPNKFICKKHGKFKASIYDHNRFVSGGCNKCDKEHQSSRQRMEIETYIRKAQKIHKCKYDYS